MMINKQIAAIPTTYAYVDFRSRLEAQYAAFFDLVDWKWEYEPINFKGWIPDFRLMIPNWFDDDDPREMMLAEVKPYRDIKEFEGSVEYQLAKQLARQERDFAIALFGQNPSVSCWQHYQGFGEQSIPERVVSWEKFWKEAGNIVRWRKAEQPAPQPPQSPGIGDFPRSRGGLFGIFDE